ncbi:hypothetical protein [Limosilactobacillus vaginalis]|uniref:hypothetical protein n=1 Tax=Limosilactobacillus vaginalis TaxID=1633 RepID=UPI00241DE585|nr:hypothetical protein [Limosilactobacillus vaginalis]
MRQIPINQAKSIIKQLLKAKSQQKISLLTNKKDRSLTIIVNDGEATVEEQGYVNDTNTYSTESTAKHEITRAFKREFPRSHQLYVSYRKDYKR